MFKKLIIGTIVITGVINLGGCSETGMMMANTDVSSSTKMSDTIFLEPAEPSQRVVYVDIKNTTDNSNLNINEIVKKNIVAKGYKITNSPKAAYYLVQANILQAGKFNKEKADKVLRGGYGSALEGGLIGAGIGKLVNRRDSAIGGAVAGAAIGYAANMLVKDIMYGAVVDVQISERAAKGVKVTESHHAHLKQGTSSEKTQYSNEATTWKRYRTRIISVAHKVNLTEEQAIPYLITGISQSISGIL
jgi:hypothetical protein